MVLFNQLTLRNILNGQDDLGTPEVRMVVAALGEVHKEDALLFLDNNIEVLSSLLSGWSTPDVKLYQKWSNKKVHLQRLVFPKLSGRPANSSVLHSENT